MTVSQVRSLCSGLIYRGIWFNLFHNSYDYLRIANEKNETFGGRNGKYCGVQYGSVSVTGQYAVLTFHSDGIDTRRGYNLTFTLIPTGCKYCNIFLQIKSNCKLRKKKNRGCHFQDTQKCMLTKSLLWLFSYH